MPVIDEKTDAYPEVIAGSIEKEMLTIDPRAEVSCATHIENGVALIAGEIEADASINASKIVKNAIDRLFSKNSLYSDT